MGRYDLTMKRLTSEFPEDYVRFALGKEPLSAEMLEVEEVDKELPTLLREVDFAARVQVGEDQAVLLVEFQTSWEADVPERMSSYAWRLYERYRLGVYPVVVVLRRGGELRDEWVMRALGREITRFRFEAIPMWEVDGEEILGQGLKGLYPLLPLMRWEERRIEEVLEDSQRLVLEEIEGRERRADAYVALQVLSGIAHPEKLIRGILRRREIMLESPFYREILEEGEARGLEKGKAIGLELGEENRLREDVLEVLEVRFGLVPPDVEESVRSLRGRKLLEGLLRRAIVIESLEAFREQVSEISV